MLVLTRKVGEALMLGNEIQVKVIAVDGDQVKLGIEAPQSLKIYRHEIFVAIQKENEMAAKITQNIDILKNW